MTQIAREEDEREDRDADERVRRDFAQDVAGENPHARPVKARIAWEACAKRRSLRGSNEPGFGRTLLSALGLGCRGRSFGRCITGSDRSGRRASSQRTQRTSLTVPQTFSAWLLFCGTAEGGRLHINRGALRSFEEQRRQRWQR